MSKHKGYQGHRNYNAWNVSLWLFNDEASYRLVQRAVRETRKIKNGVWRQNLDEATNYILNHLSSPKTGDGIPYTKTNVRLALQHFEG